MEVLEILGPVFLYMWIGYALGKITYHEYKKEVPTEELSLFGKFKRLFLFPVIYYNWGTRYTFWNFILPVFSAVYLLKENSYKISMFLWPLKLLPTAISVAQILFF